MIPINLFKECFIRTTFFIIGLAFILGMAGCGGGGGGGGAEPLTRDENVTILGTVDDGLANSPIQGARCRFIDLNGDQVGTAGISKQNGAFSVVVPPGIEGQVRCNPENFRNLVIFTYSSTMGESPGTVINEENVSPVTTIVAQKVFSEDRPDKKAHKEELLRSIETLTDADLVLVARLSSRLYKAMLEEKIDVNYGGEGAGGGNGGNGGDGGGVGGDAGDGGGFSPIPNAQCEFIIPDADGNIDVGENRAVMTDSVLDDLFTDGVINRPDLETIKDQINDQPIYQKDQIIAAYKKLFPRGFGEPIVTTTDNDGNYELPVPPHVPGYVRCAPQGFDKLALVTWVPPRLPNEILGGQDVTPQTTVFSKFIAAKLGGDLTETKENYLNDIAGLGDIGGIKTPNSDGTDTYALTPIEPGSLMPGANNDVVMMASTGVALYISYFKNKDVEVPPGPDIVPGALYGDEDFLSRLGATPILGEVKDVGDLASFNIPEHQVEATRQFIGDTVDSLGVGGVALAYIKARIRVMVKTPSGVANNGATVTIEDDICEVNNNGDGPCNATTNQDGLAILTIRPAEDVPTPVTVIVSNGLETKRSTIEVVALATVNIEFTLTESDGGSF
jgi:hypothetical protein